MDMRRFHPAFIVAVVGIVTFVVSAPIAYLATVNAAPSVDLTWAECLAIMACVAIGIGFIASIRRLLTSPPARLICEPRSRRLPH